MTCSFVVILLKLLLNYWQGDRLSHYRSQESSPVTVKVEPQQPLQKPPFVDIKHAASPLESMLKDWTNRDYLEQEKLRKGESSLFIITVKYKLCISINQHSCSLLFALDLLCTICAVWLQ